MWAEMLAPAKVPGYSKVKVRGWAEAEIMVVIAENADKLLSLLRLKRDRYIGSATTTVKVLDVLKHVHEELNLELATMLDRCARASENNI